MAPPLDPSAIPFGDLNLSIGEMPWRLKQDGLNAHSANSIMSNGDTAPAYVQIPASHLGAIFWYHRRRVAHIGDRPPRLVSIQEAIEIYTSRKSTDHLMISLFALERPNPKYGELVYGLEPSEQTEGGILGPVEPGMSVVTTFPFAFDVVVSYDPNVQRDDDDTYELPRRRRHRPYKPQKVYDASDRKLRDWEGGWNTTRTWRRHLHPDVFMSFCIWDMSNVWDGKPQPPPGIPRRLPPTFEEWQDEQYLLSLEPDEREQARDALRRLRSPQMDDYGETYVDDENGDDGDPVDEADALDGEAQGDSEDLDHNHWHDDNDQDDGEDENRLCEEDGGSGEEGGVGTDDPTQVGSEYPDELCEDEAACGKDESYDDHEDYGDDSTDDYHRPRSPYYSRRNARYRRACSQKRKAARQAIDIAIGWFW